jgi:hypothetical protein
MPRVRPVTYATELLAAIRSVGRFDDVKTPHPKEKYSRDKCRFRLDQGSGGTRCATIRNDWKWLAPLFGRSE